MKKLILAVMAAFLFGLSAFAQPLLVQDKDYEKFTKISVEDYFVLRFIKADRYSVTLKADERIAAHVHAYVKNGTLYLDLDEKSFSSELKKALRKRGTAQPLLEADVYMPTVNSVVIKDKAVLASCDRFETETFTMTVTGNALVTNVDVSCATGEINISKNAQVTGYAAVSSKMYLNVSNSGRASFTQDGGNAFISQSNSSYVDYKADINVMEIELNSGSDTHLSGVSSLLKVTGSGLSKVDAELLESEDGDVFLTGSAKCYVNVTEHLKVSLTGGSMLTFQRNPSFEIERVVNSTLIKADDAKRK